MARYSFKLPDLGEGIVESEVVEWYVKPGDQVDEDQHIADVMTDKATVEVTSPVPGSVISIACEAGTMLSVGSEMILFEVSDEHANTDTDTAPAEEITTIDQTEISSTEGIEPLPPETDEEIDMPTLEPVTDPAHRVVLASPSVRRRAHQEHIDLAVVPGSGPAGRISNRDLDVFIAAGGMQASVPTSALRGVRNGIREIPIKGLRRVIAQKMALSKQQIPHYSYVEEMDLTALEELRQHLNSNRHDNQPKLTLLPFIIQALVKVLPDFPHCNAHYDNEKELLTEYDGIHVGIATMTDKGLMVPVIKHCEGLDIWHTASELQRLSEAARDGSIKGDELKGSSITITSLGAIGGIVSTPVINAPETAIVGVNKLQERPVVREGEIVIRKMMNLSSSFDHRIVDGYDGAQMVQALKRLLEYPGSIFV